MELTENMEEFLNDLIGKRMEQVYQENDGEQYDPFNEELELKVQKVIRKLPQKQRSGVVPTLTANQGEGGHNVCIVKTKQGLRKMTPRECFNTQGFPKNYKLPKKQSDARLYKQAGNSVCVPVINRIAENILEAIK